MPNVGYATLPVIPSMRGVKNNLEKELNGTGVGDRAGRSIGGRMAAGIGTVLKKGVKLTAAGAGVVAGASLIGGFKSAVSQQNAKKVLGGLYGSAKQATDMMKDLRKSTAKSPIDYGSYTKASESLAYAGVKGKDAVKTLKNVGLAITAAGGNSENLNGATDAILKMVNAGKVQLDTLQQLSNSGVPILSGLAKHYGTSIEQVNKMASAGKIKLDDVLSVMKNGTGKTFQSMLKAGKQAQDSFGNVFTRIKNNVVTTIGTAMVPVLDKLAPVLSRAGDAVVDFLAGIQSGKGAGGAFVQRLRDLWNAAKPIGVALKDIVSAINPFALAAGSGSSKTEMLQKALDGLQSILKTTGTVLTNVAGFLTEHRTLVRQLTVVVLAGAAAWKAGKLAFAAYDAVLRKGKAAVATYHKIMTALNKMCLGTRIQLAALKVQTIAQATASKIASAATAAWTAANRAWMNMRLAASLAKARAATIAQTVAAKAAALAQRALNLVLRANPIGLVITALIALGAGLVIAYKKSETFRKIVQGAWHGIKTAALAVVNWFTGKAWPLLSKVFGWIGRAVKVLAVTYFKVYTGIIRAVFRAVGTTISTVWSGVKKVFGWMKTGLRVVRDTFSSVKARINTLWGAVGDKVSTVWSGAKKVFGHMKTGVNAVKTAFEAAKTGISTAWDKLKSIISKPIRASITWINDKLIGNVNSLIYKLVKKRPIPNIPGGYADGGILPGYTPGRDVHQFVSPTGGRLNLSGGEPILRPEVGRVVGPGWVHGVNAAARQGGPAGVRRFLGGGQAFAGGGIWDKIKGAVGFAGSAVAGSRGDAGALTAAGLTAAEQAAKIKDFALGQLKKIPGGMLATQLVAGVGRKLVGGIVSKVKDLFTKEMSVSAFGAGAAGPNGPAGSFVGRRGFRANPTGWKSLWAAVQRLDPSAHLSSSFRGGARTASGYPSYHGLGRAIDVTSPNTMGLFRKMRALYGGSATEMYYSPAGWQQMWHGAPHYPTGVTRRDHFSHIHWAMKRGGIIPPTFDGGGTLGVGDNLVRNATGAPERLHNEDRLVRQFEKVLASQARQSATSGPRELKLVSGELEMRGSKAYIRGVLAESSSTAGRAF